MNKKIAFLCLAHNNFDYLAVASNYYCAEGDGFFLHIDSSVDIKQESELNKLAHGSIILKEDERYRTTWGSFNIVLATMALINKALATGQYDRFILVSGVDLPLLTKKDLKVRLKLDLNYFGVWQTIHKDEPHMLSHEFFKRHYYDFKLTNPGLAYATGSRKKIYRMLLINRFLACFPLSKKRFIYSSYMKGSQWWCITQEMAQHFVEVFKDEGAIEQFKLMHAPDEKVFHTLAYCSPYKSKLSLDHGQGSLKQGLHYIDWGYQKAKVALQLFSLDDTDKAKQLGCAFARKISVGTSPNYQAHIEHLLKD